MMPWIIAHRGASFDAPENTLAAFRLGFEQGADYLEADLHLTLDGEIVLIHDEDTLRTTGRAGLVREQTLAELKQLDAGSWKGKQWAGERVPTLAEALATVPQGRGAFLEIKCGVEILPRLQTVMEASSVVPSKLPVMSFDLAVVQAARLLFKTNPVLWLVEFKKNEANAWTPGVEEVVQAAQAAGFAGVDVEACDGVDGGFTTRVREAGLTLTVWTVNDPLQARRLAVAGVDGITTDRPGWLREQLRA
jgi:glycerophosphoryl diester phosphodiesterase